MYHIINLKKKILNGVNKMSNIYEGLKVKIVEYKGNIIIETLKPEKDDNFLPVTEPGKVGSVLKNTEKYLGISNKAWKIIKSFRRSGDDIGEVMAWNSKDGNNGCFGWLGGLTRRIGPLATVDRNGIADIKFVSIQNILNPTIKEKIDINDQEEEHNN